MHLDLDTCDFDEPVDRLLDANRLCPLDSLPQIRSQKVVDDIAEEGPQSFTFAVTNPVSGLIESLFEGLSDYCVHRPEFVFRVDERHLVEEARSGNGETALRILQDEAGIPEHFPGFDLLTVHPETLEPDRLIELKAATCRRRKPSVSWNEWTTARNEWIQTREEPLYYLYVIGHLSKTTSSDPYIRTIANPYRILDAQVENDIELTRSIQVDIDGFTDEGLEAVSAADPVLEIPVETEEE